MNKLLTLDDLVKVCKEQKLRKFSSRVAGYSLRVQVPATFEIDDEESSSTLYAHVQVMHTGRNRNGSNLTESAAKKCLSTMAYKPLLANFCEIDGVRDFTSHDFTINEDGEVEYQERQIGCITADKAYMEDDEKVEGRKNIFARVAIPREYTDAAEIIERKNGTKVSAELEIFSMSYDAKEKELRLEEVELIGLTCLGTDPETGEAVQEGMEGSHIQLEDFSVKENPSIFTLNEEIKQFIKASIEEAVNDKNLLGKEETRMEFEENANVTETLEEQAVTEELTEAENTEEFSEDAVSEESTKEQEAVTEAQSEDDGEVTPTENESFEDEADTVSEENSDVESDEESSEEESEAEAEEDSDEVEEADTEEAESDSTFNSIKMSVNVRDEIKTFEASLNEKQQALYELVNDTYGESDNEWYGIDVYEESKTVVMYGFFQGRNFRQSYSVRKDVYSLKGDRVQVYARYLTEDEIAQLDAMRQDYAVVSEKLAQYEAEPEKIAILESEDYANLEGTEAFESLKLQENHFELSVDEVKSQCDAMLLEYAKGHKVEFAEKTTEAKATMKKKILPESPTKKAGKYGGIFSRKKDA